VTGQLGVNPLHVAPARNTPVLAPEESARADRPMEVTMIVGLRDRH
jgi:hypothetical protein